MHCYGELVRISLQMLVREQSCPVNYQSPLGQIIVSFNNSCEPVLLLCDPYITAEEHLCQRSGFGPPDAFAEFCIVCFMLLHLNSASIQEALAWNRDCT